MKIGNMKCKGRIILKKKGPNVFKQNEKPAQIFIKFILYIKYIII